MRIIDELMYLRPFQYMSFRKKALGLFFYVHYTVFIHRFPLMVLLLGGDAGCVELVI